MNEQILIKFYGQEDISYGYRNFDKNLLSNFLEKIQRIFEVRDILKRLPTSLLQLGLETRSLQSKITVRLRQGES